MPLLDELKRRYGEGEPLDALAGAALQALQSAEQMAQETDSSEGAMAALAADWSAFEQLTRTAWERYPEYESSGAHGMWPDPRAIELFGTMGYLPRVGMYTPAELARHGEQGDGQREWLVRESLRLRALLLCLLRLVDGLDTGAVSPLTYAGLVLDLARQFGATPVARPGAARC